MFLRHTCFFPLCIFPLFLYIKEWQMYDDKVVGAKQPQVSSFDCLVFFIMPLIISSHWQVVVKRVREGMTIFLSI